MLLDLLFTLPWWAWAILLAAVVAAFVFWCACRVGAWFGEA